MAADQILIAHLAGAVQPLIAIGLLTRRRVTFCWSFFFYVLAVLVSDSLIMSWPDRF